ncbi:cadherin repeat domain-containing protein, partial [Staphylococcus aureus]
VKNTYTFNGHVVSVDGETDTFTLTINVTSVNKAPVIYKKEVNLIDSATIGTGVANMTATDREGNTLTYSITAGNLDSTFSINSSTGVV